MAKPTVVYTDPLWAIGKNGRPDPARATFEHDVLGDDVELCFGPHDGSTYIREGAPLLDAVRGADALVIFRTQVTPELAAVIAPTCKVIGRQGVGYDNLNVELLRERGIHGFNLPDYCVEEVSSHAMALVLDLERRVTAQNAHIKANRWSTFGTPLARRLSELTFGILGFGRIGRATARKAQAFYRRTIAYDPYVHEDLMAGLGVDRIFELDEFVRTADVIAVHALLNAETKYILNRTSLAHARPGTLLINTARGNLIEPQAALEGIQSGRLGGYGSDVFTPEDPNADPVNAQLLAFENVIVSAHCAAYSNVSAASQRRRCAQEVRHVLLTGEPPQFGLVT